MNTFSKICCCGGEANTAYTIIKMIYTNCMKDPEEGKPEYWDTEECLQQLKVCRQSAEDLVEKLDALIGELE